MVTVKQLMLGGAVSIMLLANGCVSTTPLSFELSADTAAAPGDAVHLTVSKIKGQDDIVKLSIENYLDFLTIEISPPSDHPPFTATISYRYSNIVAESNINAWKDCTVNVLASNSNGVSKRKTILLKPTPQNAANAFDGHMYKMYRTCSVAGFDSALVTSLEDGGHVKFPDLYAIGSNDYQAVATVNPRARTLELPATTISGYIFRGIGTFELLANDNIHCSISYSKSLGASKDSCICELKMIN